MYDIYILVMKQMYHLTVSQSCACLSDFPALAVRIQYLTNNSALTPNPVSTSLIRNAGDTRLVISFQVVRRQQDAYLQGPREWS